jgi:cation transport regulator ChaB
MVETYTAERTITAVFQTEEQIDGAVRRLLDRGVSKEHISVMGRNFQSQTRISGFISKRDVILGGLRTGAVFGSLFGSLFSLLSGIGVLFIPFVGPVVAAGPIGALLLGAASGALVGSAGGGLASVLTTLGMPEEKATVYQTRLKAGEFVLMAEVSADRASEFQLLVESAGGEEMHVGDSALPRACEGRCGGVNDLSPEVRAHLSPEAQATFIEHYNSSFDQANDAAQAEQTAWQAIHDHYDEDESGVWSKVKVSA